MASDLFDVVVVGGRCAGAPLATLLSRAGLRVCVVDKDSFPSDTLSTHGIQAVGVEVLRRVGVLDELLALAPPMLRGRVVFDDGEVVFDDVASIIGGGALSVRRPALDEVLLNAAAAAGAEVRTETPVTGLVVSDGRVGGVVTADGTLRARLVVGADGRRSAVARMVGAREHHCTGNGRVFMWTYVAGDPSGGALWFGKRGDYAYLVMPTDGGLTLVAACPSVTRRDEIRADREGVFAEGIRAWPELDAAVDGLERDGPLRTMANLGGFFRPSAGPGWVLVGDAGHFKDPTPGQGISDALRQVEALAPAIGRGLANGDADRVLHEWWRWRDADAWEMYWFAHDMGAAGETPPLLRAVQRRMVADHDLAGGLLKVLNRDLPPSQLVPPDTLASVLAEALRDRRGERTAMLREAREVAANQIRRRRARPPDPLLHPVRRSGDDRRTGAGANGRTDGMATIAVQQDEHAQIEHANASGRPPVVFIHGLWLLRSSWDRWAMLFADAGFAPVTASWPGDPETVAQANAHPEAFNEQSVGKVADHVAALIGRLDSTPAVVGHSFGGLLAQIIAGRGLSAATVAIDPAPFKGVLPLPLSALKASSPVLRDPRNRTRAVALTFDQFRYAFANAVSEEEARALYAEFVVPAPGRPLFQAAFANVKPGGETKVDTQTGDRGPLLLISGEKDNTVPWALTNAAYKKQKRNEGVTEIDELSGRGHALVIDSGWREVAERALSFIQRFVATGAA